MPSKPFFRTQRVALLLDGLDEVAHAANWLLPAIRTFTDAHPDLQVVISSRAVGDMLGSLPFLGVTLLPFTDQQRQRFVSSWFGAKQRAKANNVMEHLRRHTDLLKIVSNPLLATILCVLAEHDVPLPDSEIRLYEERMRLLLGQYDPYKGSRRLKSPFLLLLRVSQKIAFELHRSNKRYASTKTLHNFAQKHFVGRESDETIARAVRELIDPCNVLLPMTEQGLYGFGHLRYQEYLVACELHGNRSIKLLPLLDSSWWKSVMVLFAEMCDDLKFLVNVLADIGPGVLKNETVQAMFAMRPEDERAALTKIVKLRHKLEDHDNRVILERDRYKFMRRTDEENYNDYEPLSQYVEEYGEISEDEPTEN